jgi:hypothetical protein
MTAPDPQSQAPAANTSSSRRILLYGVAITALIMAAASFIPLTDASARLNAFPLKGARYASREIPLDPAEIPVIGPARCIKRLCQTPTQRVLISIIDGTRNRHAMHDPEYCFRGSGWLSTERHSFAIPGGTACRLELKKDSLASEALFWFSNGQSRHSSPAKVWLQSAARRLSFGLGGPAPVLILISPAIPGTPINWQTLIEEMPELANL